MGECWCNNEFFVALNVASAFKRVSALEGIGLTLICENFVTY